MNYKSVNISYLGMPSDYCYSLVPLIIKKLGYKIQITNPLRADLVIYGPFYNKNYARLRWLPRSWRLMASLVIDLVAKELSMRHQPPITLFHTAENVRHNHVHTDFSISYDLDVESKRHIRHPYWMEIVDWSHEGVAGNNNRRFGELLNIKALMKPLGYQIISRDRKAVLVTSHLNELRSNCLQSTKKIMQVDGFGPYFDKNIRDHNRSNFSKKKILENYSFNLCPENSVAPGYITEKIPEAFAAGCLPITYVDESVGIDFNSEAMINLRSSKYENITHLRETLLGKNSLLRFADIPLITKEPSINPLIYFIKSMMESVK